jgi:hypothetical protein
VCIYPDIDFAGQPWVRRAADAGTAIAAVTAAALSAAAVLVRRGGSVPHETATVVDERFHVPRGSGEAGAGHVGLTRCDPPRASLRVDRVGLAPLAG